MGCRQRESRPECPACRRCIPIRVPVAAYSPPGSARRLLRRNRAPDRRISRDPPSREDWGLYRVHPRRFAEPGDGAEALTFEGFCRSIAPAHPFSRALRIYEDGAYLIDPGID